MVRFVRFVILVSLCSALPNLAFGDEHVAPSMVPHSIIQSSEAPYVNHDENLSSTITIDEAKDLLNLLPAVKELRARGIDVKYDVQAVSTMNNGDYYFFWIYNATAQKQQDIGSISVGNYAVNKHTADVRLWHVSNDVFHGADGVLFTSIELERLQEGLHKKHGISLATIQEYRPAHLANKIIPRELAESAVRLPITERLSDTAEVSCWKDSDQLISRMGRSPVVSSSAGFRAYAEVKAIAFKPQYQETYTGPLCENSTTLYIAREVGGTFKSVYTKTGGGNGIHVIGWSPDGVHLLAEVNRWAYESDGGVGRVATVYDASTDSAREIPELDNALTDHFGPNCEFEQAIRGWKNNDQILVKVSKSPEDESYEQHFCVEQPRMFVFNLQSKVIQEYLHQTPKAR